IESTGSKKSMEAVKKAVANRRVIRHDPPPLTPRFSESPTEAEIFLSHIFSEPLAPVGGDTTEKENKALAKALLAYQERGADDALIVEFLDAFSKSSWRASLLLNLGNGYRQNGFFSKALKAWS